MDERGPKLLRKGSLPLPWTEVAFVHDWRALGCVRESPSQFP